MSGKCSITRSKCTKVSKVSSDEPVVGAATAKPRRRGRRGALSCRRHRRRGGVRYRRKTDAEKADAAERAERARAERRPASTGSARRYRKALCLLEAAVNSLEQRVGLPPGWTRAAESVVAEWHARKHDVAYLVSRPPGVHKQRFSRARRNLELIAVLELTVDSLARGKGLPSSWPARAEALLAQWLRTMGRPPSARFPEPTGA